MQCRKDGPVPGKVGLEIPVEPLGPGRHDRLFRLGLRCRDLDPPLSTAQDHGAIEHEACEIAQSEESGGEQRDHEAVPEHDRAFAWRGFLLRRFHQMDAEIEQFPHSGHARTLGPGGLVPKPDL
jgi:hypothetical protein